MIILSFMWLLFSIPIITIGTSTTALFYVSTRRIANREGYITRDFWEAFKANFKRATLVWLMILTLLWLIWFNIRHIEVVGGLGFIIFPAQIILFVEIIFMSIYIFPMTARFDMGIKQLIKSSFFMANRHLLTSITCVVLLVAIFFSIYIVPLPLVFFLGPGMYGWLSSHMIMKVFKKYRPEMDKDPVLEIQEIEAQRAEEKRRRSIGTMSENEIDVEEIDIAKQEAALWTSLSQAKPDESEEREYPKPPPVPVKNSREKNEDDFWASLGDDDDEAEEPEERKPWEVR